MPVVDRATKTKRTFAPKGEGAEPPRQRALFFGDSFAPNGTYIAPVWEYRHPNAAIAQVNQVGITGFNVAPWPATSTASQWSLADLAFRPGCDGGILVGGRSDFSSSTGFFAKFQIDNGTACP